MTPVNLKKMTLNQMKIQKKKKKNRIKKNKKAKKRKNKKKTSSYNQNNKPSNESSKDSNSSEENVSDNTKQLQENKENVNNSKEMECDEIKCENTIKEKQEQVNMDDIINNISGYYEDGNDKSSKTRKRNASVGRIAKFNINKEDFKKSSNIKTYKKEENEIKKEKNEIVENISISKEKEPNSDCKNKLDKQNVFEQYIPAQEENTIEICCEEYNNDPQNNKTNWEQQNNISLEYLNKNTKSKNSSKYKIAKNQSATILGNKKPENIAQSVNGMELLGEEKPENCVDYVENMELLGNEIPELIPDYVDDIILHGEDLPEDMKNKEECYSLKHKSEKLEFKIKGLIDKMVRNLKLYNEELQNEVLENALNLLIDMILNKKDDYACLQNDNEFINELIDKYEKPISAALNTKLDFGSGILNNLLKCLPLCLEKAKIDSELEALQYS